MRVGIAGLGNMGVVVAERLLDGGHEVAVWNRTASACDPLAARGARVAATPAALWEHAEAVVTFLSNDAAVEAVYAGPDGLAGPAGAGRIALEMSTISPAGSARVAEASAAAGLRYLRAPVSGNPTVVRAGNLTIIVSGDRAAYDDAQELLSAIGPNLFYVGAAEEARVVKACLQLMLGGIVGILAEAVVLGDAAGLDRATLLGIINRSAVGAPVVGYKTAPLVARDYTPTFHTRLLDKDLSIGIDAASAHGLELPLAGHVRELNRACTAEGFGDLDFMSFVLHLQRLAGIPTDVDGGTA